MCLLYVSFFTQIVVKFGFLVKINRIKGRWRVVK